MKIEYLGHSCFKLTTKNGTTVVTDPYTGVGYELPKPLLADLVTVSHEHFDHNYVQGVQCEKVLRGVKNLAYKDIIVTAVETDHDPKGGSLRGKNTVYTFEMDGIRVSHLGDLGEPYNEKTAKKLGNADILLIPIGGTYTIDAENAMRYLDAIRPKMAVLMHYRPSDGTIDITPAEPFLSLYGKEKVLVPLENYIQVEKEELANLDRNVVYLQRGKSL
jgi:L-ascorbate metabolism protein UlaG (beta-lactamase superfamily)